MKAFLYISRKYLVIPFAMLYNWVLDGTLHNCLLTKLMHKFRQSLTSENPHDHSLSKNSLHASSVYSIVIVLI